MRKNFWTLSLLCTCLITEAQTPIKSRLTGVVEGIPNAPVTLEEAYRIAKITGQGTGYAVTVPSGLHVETTGDKKQFKDIVFNIAGNYTEDDMEYLPDGLLTLIKGKKKGSFAAQIKYVYNGRMYVAQKPVITQAK